jgi:hypothetical protein
LVWGVALGAIDGWLVSKYSDRAGRFSIRSVLVTAVRIPFLNVAMLAAPWAFILGTAQRDQNDG